MRANCSNLENKSSFESVSRFDFAVFDSFQFSISSTIFLFPTLVLFHSPLLPWFAFAFHNSRVRLSASSQTLPANIGNSDSLACRCVAQGEMLRSTRAHFASPLEHCLSFGFSRQDSQEALLRYDDDAALAIQFLFDNSIPTQQSNQGKSQKSKQTIESANQVIDLTSTTPENESSGQFDDSSSSSSAANSTQQASGGTSIQRPREMDEEWRCIHCSMANAPDRLQCDTCGGHKSMTREEERYRADVTKCSICFDDLIRQKSATDCFADCSHHCCPECYTQHLNSKIANGQVNELRCVACPRVVSDFEVECNVDPANYQKFRRFKDRDAMLKNPLARVCTRPNCNGVMLCDSDADARTARGLICKECGDATCSLCREPFANSFGHVCGAVLAQRHSREETSSLQLLNSDGSRRCPQCNMWVHRIDGVS